LYIVLIKFIKGIGECKMKMSAVKEKLLVILGAFAGLVSIFGYHPIAVGYYCGTYANLENGILLTFTVLLGIFIKSGYMETIRYGLSIFIFRVIYGMFGNDKKSGNIVKCAFAGAAGLLVMNITKYMLVETNNIQLAYGVAESVLVAAVTVLFYYIEEKLFLKKERTEDDMKIAGERRLSESAQMLSKLSDCFEHLPIKKEVLNTQDVNEMFEELTDRFCKGCDGYDKCWNKFYETTCNGAYEIFCQIDKNKGLRELASTSQLAGNCPHFPMLLKTANQIFEKTKNNFMWYNRLIENRSAVALQLNEVARMMQEASEEIGSQKEADKELSEKIKKKMRLHRICVESVSEKKGKNGRKEYILSLHTTNGKSVAVRDVAIYISDILGKAYEADKESRLILNQNKEIISFVEAPNYRVVHGCARVAKSGERVLGDSFSFYHSNGEVAACLSDGMGSGLVASQSSEMVIELFENFLEAGFKKETALRMMNATLVMNSQNGKYSTVDVAEIDLYAGVCEFVKMGAAVSFIKRDNSVEVIKLESLPVGAFYDQGFESATKPLYDGDYVILISDGVLSPLPNSMTDQVMAQLIAGIDTLNPKEMAKEILDKILKECDYKPADDMTVLVMGLIKK